MDKYLSGDCTKKKPLQANTTDKIPLRKRKSQLDEHFCIYDHCHKKISRGNASSKIRHADNCHKKDQSYDYEKYILPVTHEKVVKILKQAKKCDTRKDTEKV